MYISIRYVCIQVRKLRVASLAPSPCTGSIINRNLGFDLEPQQGDVALLGGWINLARQERTYSRISGNEGSGPDLTGRNLGPRRRIRGTEGEPQHRISGHVWGRGVWDCTASANIFAKHEVLHIVRAWDSTLL